MGSAGIAPDTHCAVPARVACARGAADLDSYGNKHPLAHLYCNPNPYSIAYALPDRFSDAGCEPWAPNIGAR